MPAMSMDDFRPMHPKPAWIRISRASKSPASAVRLNVTVLRSADEGR